MLNIVINERIILASKSPRRAELLSKIGIEFLVQTSHIHEHVEEFDSPEEVTIKLSRLKAEDVSMRFSHGLVIGADTIVVERGTILGKPSTMDDARKMLERLSGKTHQVITGLTILRIKDRKSISCTETTHVTFRTLESDEIEYYIQHGNPYDKAGAYGIQDESALFAERISGCFYNVVGFPLTKFYTVLKENFLDDIN